MEHHMHKGYNTDVWADDHDEIDIGEHAERYTRLGFGKPGQVGLPTSDLERSGLLVDLLGVHETLTEDVLISPDFPRSVVALCRMIHEAAAVLGRLGLHRCQINAILAAVLDDEMCRVDPARGFLDDNDGQPYRHGRSILDPPLFRPVGAQGFITRLRRLARGR